MTMITDHSATPSWVRHHLHHWLSSLTELVLKLHASWSRRQNLRALEALPADTLKDIGWPTTDSNRAKIITK